MEGHKLMFWSTVSRFSSLITKDQPAWTTPSSGGMDLPALKTKICLTGFTLKWNLVCFNSLKQFHFAFIYKHIVVVFLNPDGASRGNPGPAGCGGVFRNSSGVFLNAFSLYPGITTNTIAELQAIKLGLKLAFDMGFSKLHIESDSISAINILSRQQQLQPQLEILKKEILDLAATMEEVKLFFIYREGNPGP